MENNFKVPLTKILKVENHPGADRLDVVTVYGFQVIASKGQYKVGDLVVYVPIDSILPEWLEISLFPADSKVKLNGHRVRQIKLRGLASQGMLISSLYLKARVLIEDDDYSEQLGITKYEPPVRGSAMTASKNPGGRNKTYENKLFHKYNGLTALKWVPTVFEGQEVVIQEKLHGTNARAGILPYEANNLWKRFLKYVGLAPEFEKCYGSNNVQVSAKNKLTRNGFYETDVYGTAFKNCDVFSKLQPGEIVYGEIIGPSIQSNYDYGLSEPRFVLFDVKVQQPEGGFRWLAPVEVTVFACLRGFEMVPVLFEGIWDKETANKLTLGPSAYNPVQKVREGIVIKAANDYDCEGNKRAYKLLSEDYLADKNNTDNH